MLTGIKTQLFQNFCSTYPMFCTRRLVLSIIITILLVILILLRKKNRTERFLPIELFIGIPLHFRRIIRSPDFYLVIVFYLIALLMGKWYVAHALANKASFYTATLMGTSTPWDCGHLLGLVTILCFALFRLGCNRLISISLSFLFLLSPLQLYILGAAPDRDYSRAPWIIAILGIVTFLVRYGNTLKRISCGATLVALLCGFGGWIRPEISLFIFPSAIALFFLTPLPKENQWRNRGLSFFLLGFFFFATAPRSFLSFHPQQASAGFMMTMDGSLALTRPNYDMGHLILDEYIDANNAFMTHSTQGRKPNHSFNNLYMTTLPGDFLARIYASALRTLELPFRYHLAPIGVNSHWIKKLYSFRALILNVAQPLALPIAIATFFTLSLISLRFAFLYLGWLFFLSVIFTAQFWARHHFYGEFFSWWNIGLLLQTTVFLTFNGAWSKKSEKKWKISFCTVGTAGCGTALLLIVFWGGLSGLRFFQEKNLNMIFSSFEKLKTDPVDLKMLKNNAIATSHQRAVGFGVYLGTEPQFMIAEFGGKTCSYSTLWPVIRYVSIEMDYLKRFDWSRTLRVDLHGNPPSTKVYFPTWQGFQGIEFPPKQSHCFLSLNRVINPELVSIPLTATLPSPLSTPYQQLEILNAHRLLWGTFPSSENWEVLLRQGIFNLIKQDEIIYQASIVERDHEGWLVNGYAQPPVDPHMFIHHDRTRSRLGSIWAADISPSQVDTDLLFTKVKPHKKGELLIVQGTLYTGGLSVGLIHEGQSAGSVPVTSPGDFTLLIRVQEQGDYSVGIANNLSWYNFPETRFIITKAGWLEPSD